MRPCALSPPVLYEWVSYPAIIRISQEKEKREKWLTWDSSNSPSQLKIGRTEDGIRSLFLPSPKLSTCLVSSSSFRSWSSTISSRAWPTCRAFFSSFPSSLQSPFCPLIRSFYYYYLILLTEYMFPGWRPWCIRLVSCYMSKLNKMFWELMSI